MTNSAHSLVLTQSTSSYNMTFVLELTFSWTKGECQSGEPTNRTAIARQYN